MRADAKLQRWIDLIAALLCYRYGVTLAELKTIVPGYGGAGSRQPSTRCSSDKDELRALGLPIRVRPGDIENGQGQGTKLR
jgi:hypothetical protein